MRLKLREEHGFSLVELAVYIVLLGILMSIVATVITTSFRAEQAVAANTKTANSVQTFSAAFYRDVRNSRSAEILDAGSRVRLCTVTTNTVTSTDPVRWRYVIWSFSGNSLTRKDGGATEAFLYDGVTGNKMFGVSGREVSYDFLFAERGSTSREVLGSIRLGPVDTRLNTTVPISDPQYGKVLCP